MSARQTVVRLLSVNAEMKNLKVAEAELAAVRLQLIQELTGRWHWSQYRVAGLLDVTPQRISAMLAAKRR